MKEHNKTLAECHCLNLRWLTNQTIEQYDRCLLPVGITIQQYSVLKYIAAMSPITVTDLAAKLKLDRTTFSRGIKVLTDRKLIMYTIPKGRGKQLALTDQGQKVMVSADKAWAGAQRQFADKLGPERLEQWNSLLEFMLREDEQEIKNVK